jgi:hypothetical protein
VTIEVVVPTLNDERSREIMRELAKLNNQDPRVALFEKSREQGTGARDQGPGTRD